MLSSVVWYDLHQLYGQFIGATIINTRELDNLTLGTEVINLEPIELKVYGFD